MLTEKTGIPSAYGRETNEYLISQQIRDKKTEEAADMVPATLPTREEAAALESYYNRTITTIGYFKEKNFTMPHPVQHENVNDDPKKDIPVYEEYIGDVPGTPTPGPGKDYNERQKTPTPTPTLFDIKQAPANAPGTPAHKTGATNNEPENTSQATELKNTTAKEVSKDLISEGLNYNEIKDAFALGNLQEITDKRVEAILEEMKKSGYITQKEKEGEYRKAFDEKLKMRKDYQISKAVIDAHKDSKKPELTCTAGSEYCMGQKKKIDYLIVDNYPEQILGEGSKSLGTHQVPSGHNLLTSYHINSSKDGKSKKIVYNFTANDKDTVIRFEKENYSVDGNGLKAGAEAVGEKFINGNIILKNALLNDSYGKVKTLKISEELANPEKKAVKKGNSVTVHLNPGETLSFESEKPVGNNQVFASAIEFTNNKKVEVNIRSISADSDRFLEIDQAPDHYGDSYNSWYKSNLKLSEKHFNDIKNEMNDNLNDNKNKDNNVDDMVSYFIAKKSAERELSIIEANKQKKDGEGKQVSGVFKDPNYDITGRITAVEKNGNRFTNAGTSSLITIPPPGKEATSIDVLNMKKNKGEFFQNFHYKLEITNYRNKEYRVVLVPGGGSIASYGQKSPPKATANDIDNTAIRIPSKVVKDGGKYYIQFDYFPVGDSSSPSYAKIIEKD